MAVSVENLPPYPSSKARAALSPSQAATLCQTISSRLRQTLALPAAQSNTPATLTFIASYAKDSAQLLLNSLIWEQAQVSPHNVFSNLSPAEKSIRQCVFLLAERLATSGSLDLQVLLDLSVTYGSTSLTRFRALFSTALSSSTTSLVSQVNDAGVFPKVDAAAEEQQAIIVTSMFLPRSLCWHIPRPHLCIIPVFRSAHRSPFNPTVFMALERQIDSSLGKIPIAVSQDYEQLASHAIVFATTTTALHDDDDHCLTEGDFKCFIL